MSGGRGSAGAGRPALLPSAAYEPPAAVCEAATGSLVVEFCGEDGRRASLRVDQLPLSGWHRPLAAAFAARVGPAGALVAAGEWGWLVGR